MKKNFALLSGLVLLLCIVFSCEKKNNSAAISPDYGATGNPNPNNQTVTGSNTFTNPAIENSSFVVGDIGWSNPSCVSTGSTSLRATKGLTEVVLTFSGVATTNTYNISSQPAANSCKLEILNAPGQPAGIMWYGRSGSVIVTTTSTSINAQLLNAVCTQSTFNFPLVTVSGNLGCSQ